MAHRSLLLLLLLPALGCPSVPADDDDTGSTSCSGITAAQNPPTVELTAPPQSQIFASSDSISVIGTLSDEGTDPADLGLELLEVINVTPEPIDVPIPTPSASGALSFSIPGGTLGAGNHVIRLRATDPDGCRGFDDRFFCVDTADCVAN